MFRRKVLQKKKQATTPRETPRYKMSEESLVRQILVELCSIGWSVDRFESKAQRMVTNGGRVVFRNSGLREGFSDIAGCSSIGQAVFIEVKLPGRRVPSGLRPKQRDFLLEKIEHNAFACVSCSFQHVMNLYNMWLVLDPPSRRELLIDDLPSIGARKSKVLTQKKSI